MNKEGRVFKYLQWFSITLLCVTVIGLIIYRFCNGIEITDEACVIAEADMILKGGIPIADMWQQSPCYSILNVPFVWIVKMINGGTEGIVLSMRIVCLIVKIAALLLTCWLLRKYIIPEICVLWLLPLICFAPHSGYVMGYNSWTIILLQLAGVVLFYAENSQTNKNKLGFITGVLWAMVVFAYPTNIILTIILILITLAYEYYYCDRQFTVLKWCVCGGIIAGMTLFMFIVIKSGSLMLFFEGIKTILYDNPYMKLPKGVTNDALALLYKYIANYIKMLVVAYCIAYVPIGKRKHREYCLLLLVVGGILYSVRTIYLANYARIFGEQSGYQYSTILCLYLFAIPCMLLPLIKEHRKTAIGLLCFVYIPALLCCTISSLSAYSGLNNRYFFLVNASLLTVPFLYWAICEQLNEKVAFIVSYVVSGLICLVFLMNYYSYMYRDTPFYENHFKVNAGVYKGLYTTPMRGAAIMRLESRIRENTKQNDVILFMDCVPMVYLMTDATHCAPSSWDIQLYTYRFMEDTLLQKYLRVTKKIPVKIIYIWTGRDKILSIDEPQYKFNTYVNAHYKLSKTIQDDLFPIKIYEIAK